MNKIYMSLLVAGLAISSAFAQTSVPTFSPVLVHKTVKSVPHPGTSSVMLAGDSLNNYVNFLSQKERLGTVNYPYYTKHDFNCSYVIGDAERGNYGGWAGSFVPSFAYQGGTTGNNYGFDHHQIYYKATCLTGCTGTPTARWYNYGDAKDAYVKMMSSNLDSSTFAGSYLHPDTTILVKYSTGYDAPWIHALGDVLDVNSSYLNNNTIFPLASNLHMTAASTFTLDSLEFGFFYARKDGDAANVDTLVIELALNANTSLQVGYFCCAASSGLSVATNLGTDTVFMADIPYDFNANGLNIPTKTRYTFPLTQADYDGAATNNFFLDVQFAPNAPTTVNAGELVVASVAFKSGVSPTIGIAEKANTSFTLSQNTPNPFNHTSTINYDLKNASQVSFEITDLTGRVVKSINEGNQTSGKHSIIVNSNDYSKGVYFYTMKANGASLTKKMVIVQ